MLSTQLKGNGNDSVISAIIDGGKFHGVEEKIYFMHSGTIL